MQAGIGPIGERGFNDFLDTAGTQIRFLGHIGDVPPFLPDIVTGDSLSQD